MMDGLLLFWGGFFGAAWVLSLFNIYAYYYLVRNRRAYKGMMPIGMRIILSVMIGSMSLALLLRGMEVF